MDSQPLTALSRSLAEAPGGRAARICGILSIIFAITCVGIPVAIVLGIIALVQQAKAKRMAKEFPDEFQTPANSGMVLGIIGLILPVLMLPFAGIVAAIAIPAVLAQRGRAVSKVISFNLGTRMEQLAAEYSKGKEVGMDQPTIHASLEQAVQAFDERNPVNPAAPAFRHTISIITASTQEETLQQAEAEAEVEGQMVFVVSYPSEANSHGYLAGAAKLKVPVNGSSIVSQSMELD